MHGARLKPGIKINVHRIDSQRQAAYLAVLVIADPQPGVMRQPIQSVKRIALMVGATQKIIGIGEGIQHGIPLRVTIETENLPLMPF